MDGFIIFLSFLSSLLSLVVFHCDGTESAIIRAFFNPNIYIFLNLK